MSEELKSPDAVRVCLFVWILIVFILFICLFIFVFTGVLHSNIYIGRGFFCALILSNYGNTSWQNRKQNNRGKKENIKLVVMKHDALDKSEILSWSQLVACSLWGFSLNCKLRPSRSPLWCWRRSGLSCSLQSESWVTRLSRRGGRGG